jgi:uncharacterized protein
MKKTIAFTGYRGFIASALRKMFKEEGCRCVALERNASTDEWRKVIEESDVVINLAGKPVFHRWNRKNREEILNSRVDTTKRLVDILNLIQVPDSNKKLLISASAIGIYPDTGEKMLSESDDEIGDSFLSEVVKAWESAALQLSNPNVRLVIPRIGIVLHKNGGMLKKVLPLFKLGIGGKIASGNQRMSFVQLSDLLSAFRYFIQHDELQGVFNLVTPHPVTNKVFTRTLSKRLHRPAFVPVPAFALYLLFGKAARIMVNGEYVVPTNLLKAGFIFEYPDIDTALDFSLTS